MAKLKEVVKYSRIFDADPDFLRKGKPKGGYQNKEDDIEKVLNEELGRFNGSTTNYLRTKYDSFLIDVDRDQTNVRETGSYKTTIEIQVMPPSNIIPQALEILLTNAEYTHETMLQPQTH
jgi:hypothetical protein|tara:strand:+ start:869 stop:1228 length:360 start_codon:yes stop_codon:yes gene_type:complete